MKSSTHYFEKKVSDKLRFASKLKSLGKWLLIIVGFLVVVWIVYSVVVQPSNNRDWQSEYKLQSTASVNGDLVTLYNIRNQTYNSSQPTGISYYNQTFDLSQLSGLHYYVVNISNIPGVAHSFFEFNFENGTVISISVEARREVGEEYSVYWGMLRSFEIFYVWAPLSDNVLRRAIWQHSVMSRYPILISKPVLRALFLQLVSDTNKLQTEPRFYHTLFNACTSNLFDAVQEVSPKKLPFTIADTLPGYAPQYLYDLELINLTGVGSVSRENVSDVFKVNDLSYVR